MDSFFLYIDYTIADHHHMSASARTVSLSPHHHQQQQHQQQNLHSYYGLNTDHYHHQHHEHGHHYYPQPPMTTPTAQQMLVTNTNNHQHQNNVITNNNHNGINNNNNRLSSEYPIGVHGVEKRCCHSCRCSNRLVTGIVITILPIAITSTLICVFMMQKTNLHQYAIYSFVIFCVAFVFPFALFFFTVVLNKVILNINFVN